MRAVEDSNKLGNKCVGYGIQSSLTLAVKLRMGVMQEMISATLSKSACGNP